MFGFLYTALMFILVFGFLVFIHELGHFIAARFFNVGVSDFSIGFGQKLFTYKDRKNTQWSIRAIPFGGFVGIIEEKQKNIPGITMQELSYYKKLVVYCSGPISNIITAFFLAFVTIWSFGLAPTPNTIIASSKIEHIQPGDKIMTIDGQDVQNWNQVRLALLNKSEALISIKRDYVTELHQIQAQQIKQPVKQTIILKILNLFTTTNTHRTINTWPIEPIKTEKREYKMTGALQKAFYVLLAGLMEFVIMLKLIVRYGVGMLSGPIGIAKGLTSAAAYGLEPVLWLTIKLSLSLGMFNILPLPMLDGGQVLTSTLEKIKGKPLSERFLYIWGYSGLIFIISLMLYVSFSDLIK